MKIYCITLKTVSNGDKLYNMEKVKLLRDSIIWFDLSHKEMANANNQL
jgi:hypothetical protein